MNATEVLALEGIVVRRIERKTVSYRLTRKEAYDDYKRKN